MADKQAVDLAAVMVTCFVVTDVTYDTWAATVSGVESAAVALVLATEVTIKQWQLW